MVSSNLENLVYDIKLSSVVPASGTGMDVNYEPSNMDLVMKLHYLKGVYFFNKEAVQGITIYKIKESMFHWLDLYYITCGRFRRFEESGKPFIRCNDCGVRIIEAKCDISVDEFLALQDCSLQSRLVYNQVIGPELTFSPLVMIQLTRFKCGGMAVGLRWSHVLGDAFSATEYINMWAKVLAAQTQSSSLPKYQTQAQIHTEAHDQRSCVNHDKSSLPVLSVKRVDPVGDYWITPNNCKMATLSFEITPTQLTNLQSKVSDQSQNSHISPFVSISAVIWQCLAKAREGFEPNTVTICRSNGNGYLGNNPILSFVKADFSIAKSQPMELVTLIMEQNVDERSRIEKAVVAKDPSDYIVYGANPTFVDLEEVNLYGLELNGLKPIYANYMVHGVGDEGTILVLPGPNGGRTVTITVPEGQIFKLKTEMKKEWHIG